MTGGNHRTVSRGAKPGDSERHYWDAAALFDAMADTYDLRLHADHNRSTATIRRIMRGLVSRYIPSTGSVIDLGCGSGDDTLFLAGRGNSVVGIDLSASMVAVAQEKVEKNGLGSRVHLAVGPASEVVSLWEGRQREDNPPVGVVSSFGVLNCEPGMAKLVEGLAGILPSGACMVAMFMGRLSPWHLLSAVRHRSVVRDWARLWKGKSKVGSGEDAIDIHYWFPNEVVAMFQAEFVVREVRPIGIVLPPPDRLGRALRNRSVHRVLSQLDLRLTSSRWCRGLGDHFAIVLERRV